MSSPSRNTRSREERQPTARSPRRSSSTASSPRRSPNKIYRTPPTPPPVEHILREKSFILDCIAVDTTSKDYVNVNPKLGQVTRPYNAQKDRGAKSYFGFQGVNKTLERTEQNTPRLGTSIEGPVYDRFYEGGAGFRYLYRRNIAGAGHSGETIDGHSRFMTDLKPIYGYNGNFGYRRNNPSLRKMPSPFGPGTTSPLY